VGLAEPQRVSGSISEPVDLVELAQRHTVGLVGARPLPLMLMPQTQKQVLRGQVRVAAGDPGLLFTNDVDDGLLDQDRRQGTVTLVGRAASGGLVGSVG